jgi:hypothetical protein
VHACRRKRTAENNTTTRAAVRRAVTAVLAIGTAAFALITAAPPAARAAECAGADVVPAADNLDVAAEATVCLLNDGAPPTAFRR